MSKSFQFCAALAVTAIMLAAGCDTKSTEPEVAAAESNTTEHSKVAVIDVAMIYQAMGYQHERTTRIRALQKKQIELRTDLAAKYKAKIDEFGGDVEKLTDPQKQELQQLQADATRTGQEAVANAERAIRELDQFLNNRFQQATRQPIKNIAKAEDIDIVLVKQPNVFAFINPDIDITDKVLEQLDLPKGLPSTTPLPTDLPSIDKTPGDQPAQKAPVESETSEPRAATEQPAKEGETPDTN